MSDVIRSEYNHFTRFMQPIPFRRSPARELRAVPGGRWQVRKLIDGRWRAWSKGKAQKYSRTFETQQEAAQWAHAIAETFAVNDPDTREQLRRGLIEKRGKDAQRKPY